MASIYGRKSVLETIDAGENIKKAHILDNKGKNHRLIDKIINKLEEENVRSNRRSSQSWCNN